MKSEVILEKSNVKSNTDEHLRGFDNALKLFKKVSLHVPAYKDFLKGHRINPENINTLDDFKGVPIITKENYLKKYSYRELMWEDEYNDVRIISASSGSSGKPFFWPRGNKSVEESVIILDDLLDKSFNTRRKNTLCINAFAMGTWIAGTYMSSAMWRLSDLGHKITTITPGITKEEVARELEILSPEFDQTIIMGYPPFVKDIVDYAKERGIKLSKLNIKCIFAGENYSEQWRDYILSSIGQKNKPETTLGIYGTADAGIVGIESPLSSMVRRLSTKNELLYKSLFGKSKILPSLVQYNPDLRFIEDVDGRIIFSSDSSLPLIRYEILDEGAILTSGNIKESLQKIDKKIPTKYTSFSNYPYIALYGRLDVAATFYALNIYPENIKYGLETDLLRSIVTGKFVVEAKFDDSTQEQELNINVELQPGVISDKKLENKIRKSILDSLIKYNSEYGKLYQEVGKKVEPVIFLLEQGSPDFKMGIKHRWFKK